jgi:non-specific serine/threonine protein kinase
MYVAAMAEDSEPVLLRTDRTWLDRLQEEHDNVRAALRWSIDSGDAETGMRIAASLWRFWQVRSHLAEGLAWMEQILALPGAGERTLLRAKALGSLGSMAYYSGTYANVQEPYEESFEIATELGDRKAEAEASFNLAFARLLDRRPDEAETFLRRAVELDVALGDPVAAAHAKAGLAMAMARRGDLDGAEAMVEEVRGEFVEAEDLWGITFSSGVAASFAVRRENYAAARAAMVQSLDASESLAVSEWMAVALLGVAALNVREGDPANAVRLAGAANRMVERAGGAEPPRAMLGIEDAVELAKGDLSQSEIDALWEEGRALDVDAALALARSSTTVSS